MIKFYKDENGEILFSLNEVSNLKEIKANSVDAAVEKHVPVYEVNGDNIEVSIGDALHPMEENHYIMWIALVYDNKMSMVKLNPGDEPKATFEYKPGSKIYAYCNLHGLWVNEVN
ncbi:MAG: desulfoferrodoxin [Bacilli bacterium]|nr:desulfoferrodoxin [Bacilli bacterium]